MTSVVLRPNENQDQLLKRFRKKVVKSGVLSTVRRKRWFVSKSETDRVERKKTLRRRRRHATVLPEKAISSADVLHDEFIRWLRKKIVR